MLLDPRIGKLNCGKFYAFAHGYNKPETIGTLEEVEIAIGLRRQPGTAMQSGPKVQYWNVKLTFQYPAWDEVHGIDYHGISARSKSEANAIARRRAANDGHLGGGKGRTTFTATTQHEE